VIDLKVSDVRPFVPSKDFEVSRDFYVALGWTVHPIDDSLALLENGNHRFYLQRYYTKEFAENMMLHVTVADARACAEQIKELLASGRFPGVRVSQPKQRAIRCTRDVRMGSRRCAPSSRAVDRSVAFACPRWQIRKISSAYTNGMPTRGIAAADRI
jgi:hypothetical protein